MRGNVYSAVLVAVVLGLLYVADLPDDDVVREGISKYFNTQFTTWNQVWAGSIAIER